MDDEALDHWVASSKASHDTFVAFGADVAAHMALQVTLTPAARRQIINRPWLPGELEE